MTKINALHLFESYLPQTENWAYNLISHLSNTNIHVAANHYLKNNFYHPDFQFCDNYYDGLRAYNLNKKPGKFKKAIIKTIPYIFGNPEKNIRKYGQEQQINLVHAHFADVAWRFRNIPRKLKVPFVVSFYGWDYEMLPHTEPIYKKRYKKLFKVVDKFICEGTHGQNTLVEMGCPFEKIEVVRLGVQTDNIPFFKREKNANELKLIQVASFYEKKGHFYTTRAFLKALKTCPNVRLTLVGQDKKNGIVQAVKNLVRKSGHEDKIDIIKSIDISKLHTFFKDYDVFIHPSCYAENRDCEGGAPIVLLDAQATGMPVISTQHCDIPEEVIHEKTGLLVEEKNAEALAKSIEHFYNMTTQEYNNFSKMARSHVKFHYDIKNNAAKLQELYNKLTRK